MKLVFPKHLGRQIYCYLIWTRLVVGLARHSLNRYSNLVADPNDPLRFLVGILVELAVCRALNQNAHLVVVDLAELV